LLLAKAGDPNDFAKQGIKVLGIAFQGHGRLSYFNAVRRLTFLLSPYSTLFFPFSTNYR
jgi:hypothetical protein